MFSRGARSLAPCRIIISSLLMASGVTAAEQSTEPYVLELAVAPWQPVIGTKNHPGFMEKYVKTMLEREGTFEVRFRIMDDWPQAVQSVRDQRSYGTLPYLRTPEREKDFRFSTVPVMYEHRFLFCRADRLPTLLSTLDGRIENMKGFSIARPRGNAPWQDPLKIGYADRQFETTAECFDALESGAVDFVSESLLVGLQHISTRGSTKEAFSTNSTSSRRASDINRKFLFLPLERRFGLPLEKAPMFIMTQRRDTHDVVMKRIDFLIASYNDPDHLKRLMKEAYHGVSHLLPEEIRSKGGLGKNLAGKEAAGNTTFVPAGSSGLALQWRDDNKVTCLMTGGPRTGMILHLEQAEVEIIGPMNTDFLSE
jgi:hypothetical protein